MLKTLPITDNKNIVEYGVRIIWGDYIGCLVIMYTKNIAHNR